MIRAEGSSHRILNLLLQAQELEMTKAQLLAGKPGARTTALEESIESMVGELPGEHAAAFRRLVGRDGMAIVPVNGLNCSACAMAIPVGTVNEIRAADRIHTCPACARYLYVQQGRPKGQRRKSIPGAKPLVGVARFSGQELMLPGIAARSMEDCLDTICATLKEKGFVDDPVRLREEALKREALTSTALGNALAFPHVRGVEGGGLTLAVATSRKGVDFNGASPLPRLIFFMVIPTAASGFYLKLLAGLARTFQEKEEREAMLECETPEALWKALVKLTKKTIV
jgi:mannitol/fructose-specific phosphotransferase system IIA component (Ntr-type)